ncbi:NADH-quinone oxidoreductase subunit C [Helicobacter ailurogastricus]|uniref:NADH-quinone oxidoreductase subunit C n=1 Tax=Helicobacter ailurogastricus TaxID=1578720 RepID=UPI0022BB7FEB|nr:NADH-quinone oxidoreductase subunit C [Helicobacter ailurogastricus]GLH58332.1 NADH-quinone oxidoreductase [Helicobacter ailurogastricus]GLH59852.1 NADH-quinone oxidoreductase [Helicobacter ailurogastricus]
MVRKQRPNANVQKQVHYSDRFYVVPATPKAPIVGSPYEVIFNHISYHHKVLESFIELGNAVFVIEVSEVAQVAERLKNLGYETLSEMSAIDFLEKRGEFELFYQFLSYLPGYANKRRVRLKATLKQEERAPTLSHLFRSALWSEREAYDMFGIVFENHPHLKRILMPDDWVGYPLLKSYPLKGDEHAAWYEVDKIFGKEYREIIGPEQRDSARVDDKDTFNFSKVGHEQAKGLPLEDKAGKYSFEKSLFVKDLHSQEPTELKDRP